MRIRAQVCLDPPICQEEARNSDLKEKSNSCNSSKKAEVYIPPGSVFTTDTVLWRKSKMESCRHWRWFKERVVEVVHSFDWRWFRRVVECPSFIGGGLGEWLSVLALNWRWLGEWLSAALADYLNWICHLPVLSA